MGLIVFPVFEPPFNGDQPATTGEFLGSHWQEIDEAAEELGLSPLTAFADNRAVPEDFDGDPDDLDELLGPCDEWFGAAEGERAMLALADAMTINPDAFELGDVTDAVVEELRDLAAVLGRGAAKGHRFRLELSS